MEELKLANHNTTLVDSVEESLISYFKEQGLRPGCSIPNEMELAASLGVGRAVLREALSRFKMTGMIVSRTKKGMVLGEPSLLGGMKRCINPLLMNESTLCDILEFRVALEIGISDNIFRNLTDADVAELKEIVEMSQVIGNNKYAPVSEHRFHTKLYEITGNHIITEFQDIIYPALDFVKEQYRHCKTLLVTADALPLLGAAGIMAQLPDGSPDPGLVSADGDAAAGIDAFLHALARHRHFEREADPPRV